MPGATLLKRAAGGCIAAQEPALAAEQPALQAQPVYAPAAQQPILTAQRPHLTAENCCLTSAERAMLPPLPGRLHVKQLEQFIYFNLTALLQHFAEISYRLSCGEYEAFRRPEDRREACLFMQYQRRESMLSMPCDLPALLQRGDVSCLFASESERLELSSRLRLDCLSPFLLLCDFTTGDPGPIFTLIKRLLHWRQPESACFDLPPAALKTHLGAALLQCGVPLNFIVANLNWGSAAALQHLIGAAAPAPLAYSGICRSSKDSACPEMIALTTAALNFYAILQCCLVDAAPEDSHLARVQQLPLNLYAAAGAYHCMRALLKLSCFIPWLTSGGQQKVPSFKFFLSVIKDFIHDQLPLCSCQAHYPLRQRQANVISERLLPCNGVYLPLTSTHRGHLPAHAPGCPCCALRAQYLAAASCGRADEILPNFSYQPADMLEN